MMDRTNSLTPLDYGQHRGKQKMLSIKVDVFIQEPIV